MVARVTAPPLVSGWALPASSAVARHLALSLARREPADDGRRPSHRDWARPLPDRPLAYRLEWSGRPRSISRPCSRCRGRPCRHLVDEADSLFSKRTDVKSSNDRYANLEVNYSCSGWSRRRHHHPNDEPRHRRSTRRFGAACRSGSSSRFRKPMNARESGELTLPSKARVASNVDFAELAEAYEMTAATSATRPCEPRSSRPQPGATSRRAICGGQRTSRWPRWARL